MELYHLLTTPPVRLFPLRWLLAPLALLAILNCATLFIHSDVDIPLLWSQCHSRERLPALSYVPLLGSPSCFLLSFYEVALDSARSRAAIAVLLSFVGALATVSWLESARAWNDRHGVIKNPVPAWLAFSLLGPAGAVVWHVVLVPAYVHRARTLFLLARGSGERDDNDDDDDDDDVEDAAQQDQEEDVALAGEAGRMLPDADAVAVPVAVALGFSVPSALMLSLRTAPLIAVWLFFPVYVALVQRGARLAVRRVQRSGPTSVLLERHWQAVALVYALPVVLSVLSYGVLWWHVLARADDRRRMTVLTGSFVEINGVAVFVAVLYWLLVEAGWRVPLFVVVVSGALGPGAGLCLGWLYRERVLRYGFGGGGEGDDERGVHEDTPLLR